MFLIAFSLNKENIQNWKLEFKDQKEALAGDPTPPA